MTPLSAQQLRYIFWHLGEAIREGDERALNLNLTAGESQWKKYVSSFEAFKIIEAWEKGDEDTVYFLLGELAKKGL